MPHAILLGFDFLLARPAITAIARRAAACSIYALMPCSMILIRCLEQVWRGASSSIRVSRRGARLHRPSTRRHPNAIDHSTSRLGRPALRKLEPPHIATDALVER